MQMMKINSVRFGAVLKAPTLSKTIDRSLLKGKISNLKPLYGPEEIEKAKGIVAINVAENAALAAGMAQMPGWDEVALSANEIKMAMEIYNGIYDFGFSKTAIKSILTGFIGNKIGSWVFKGASKLFTWIPGIGNGLNATVAGGTTAILGAHIIDHAEEMDKARKNGKRLNDFLDELDK